MRTIANKTQAPVANQTPEVRFNWGYWDGAVLAATGRQRRDGVTLDTILQKHFDPFYAHGYVAGAEAHAAGRLAMTSKPAWAEFLADLTDPDLLFFAEAE